MPFKDESFLQELTQAFQAECIVKELCHVFTRFHTCLHQLPTERRRPTTSNEIVKTLQNFAELQKSLKQIKYKYELHSLFSLVQFSRGLWYLLTPSRLAARYTASVACYHVATHN